MVLADKQRIRHAVKRIEKLKTWQLVTLLIMASFLAATFLRLNNIGMIERRDAVIAADKAGDAVQLEKRLYDLQRYVSTHMNTDPGRIALDHTYQRDNDKLKEEFEQQLASGADGGAHAQAIAVCDPIGQAQGWRWPDPRYTSCIETELNRYDESVTRQYEFKPLSPAPYYHTFAAPLWSPDFAGWSVVVCGIILLLIVGRLVTLGVLRLLLMRQYRRS